MQSTLKINFHTSYRCTTTKRNCNRLHIAAASKIEFIPFQPIQKTDQFSLRLYSPHPVALTEYTKRDEGFLALGSYMSGANIGEVKMLETQPLIMTYYPDGRKTMQVYVSRRDGNSKEAPPQPTNTDIELDIAGGELIAVRSFEGYATEDTCRQELKALIQSLEGTGLALGDVEGQGGFRLAQYGPIHSLEKRTNEIWLSVKASLG